MTTKDSFPSSYWPLSTQTKFFWVSVGTNASASDAQLFNSFELGPMLEENDLGLPAPDPLPGYNKDTPYFLIGDNAFPLRPWMMKPQLD